MFWKAFIYIFLPPGLALMLLLLSGHRLAMSCASTVLRAPVRIGSVSLSLAVFATAVCSVLAVVSYSGLQMSESKLQELEQGTTTFTDRATIMDRRTKAFAQGRNLYLSLLGVTLWGCAWRLHVLYNAKQLGPPKVEGQRASPVKRIAFTVVGLVLLVLADIPLCRINYNVQLLTFVTPWKVSMGRTATECKGVYAANAEGRCVQFCKDVQNLSAERLATIKWARKWHVMGRYAAQIFDDARGVQQGEARIEELFKKKPCADVLVGVDKSNALVNWTCVAFAGLAIVGAFIALGNAFEGAPDDGGVVASVPQASAPPMPTYGNAPKKDD
mmetsp:Transcript_108329/g.313030  ORF Transcript_108329/g.313030 Transcript_108329/m.313030 type:complete len:329 (+) Transcript_108329:75-1061(+)